MGVAFYPVFYLEIEGIPITQDGPAITVRVDEKKVNKVNIPVLESIETGFAYVKIENASLYSLVFNQGGYELTPLGGDSTIVMPGETAAYRIEPHDTQSFSFMRNASSPVPFPAGIQTFARDTIYSFKYDGKALTLSGVNPLFPAPRNIVLKAGNGSITVTWDAVPRAGSYSVYYSTSQTPPETPTQSGITGTTATINGLVNDTAYYVWVASVNSGGSSMSGAKAITLALPAPQVVLEAGDGSITVKWDAVSLAGSYNVYYSTGETRPETAAQTGITGTTATISGLTNGTIYYVWVESVNAGGSSMSEAKTITLTLPAPQVVLDDGNDRITVTWDAVSLASSYSVYYSATQTRTETAAQTGITGTTAAISGLTNGTTCYVWVESVNSGGSTMSGAKSIAIPGIISNITYSSVSSGTWTLQIDGRRKSPAISHGSVTKARISFTSTANASITIQLDVSSESDDRAFISQLDNASATYQSGYYSGSRISGITSVTVTIPVTSAGSHFIDIGYGKDGSATSGSDCAWFTVIQ
jgi:fibronectin type 3 domain-containing protein